MTWLRLGLGARPLPLGARPALPLELFEFEGCPFCRKAREAISLLDLPTKIWPCPKGGTRFRPRAAALASRLTFPLLVDPNQPAAEQLTQGSDRIVAALFARYGAGAPPRLLRAGPLGDGLSALASAARPGRGRTARPRRGETDPGLELHAPEGLAAARPVREQLSELELPYLLRPFAAPVAPVLLDGPQRLVGAAAIHAHLTARFELGGGA